MVCVGTAERVVPGALYVNNAVLRVLFAGDPVGTCVRSATFPVQARFPPQLLLVDSLHVTHRRDSISHLPLPVKPVADYVPL